jgi:hypothetical protein
VFFEGYMMMIYGLALDYMLEAYLGCSTNPSVWIEAFMLRYIDVHVKYSISEVMALCL